jgi:hypothetical protein
MPGNKRKILHKVISNVTLSQAPAGRSTFLYSLPVVIVTVQKGRPCVLLHI